MDGRVETELLVHAGDIVDLTVGQEDRATDPGRWHVRDRRGEGREKPRRWRIRFRWIARLDDARLYARKLGQAVLEHRQGIVGHLGALRRVLAQAAVDDDGNDGRELIAVFLHQHGVGECCQQGEGGERADPAPTQAPVDRKRRDGERQYRER